MSQTVRARYDYDSYGNVTKVSGDMDNLFLYTGHFWHSQSGLYLTLFRAYEPKLGRWLSRDPIGELDDTNLYAYVGNAPMDRWDPLGLWNAWAPATWGVPTGAGQNPWNPMDSSAAWDGVFDSLADTGTSVGGFWKDVVTGDWGNIANRYDQGPIGQAERLTNPCSSNWVERHAYGLTVGATAFAAAAAAAAGGLLAAEAVGVTGGAAGEGSIARIPVQNLLKAGWQAKPWELHPAHHRFLGQAMRHLQKNWWIKGLKNSGAVLRIPIPW